VAADVQWRIEKAAVLYFRENAHPDTGLVRANATNFTDGPDGPIAAPPSLPLATAWPC
jgi:hypothetical protein